MDYSLLLAVAAPAAGMLALERWCSWRLSVRRRRSIVAATEPTLADALGLKTRR